MRGRVERGLSRAQEASMAKDDPGTVTTKHLEGKIVETIYKGYITVPMVEDVNVSLDRFLLQNPGGNWLIDAVEATGIAPAPHDLRMKVFRTFQHRGGDRIATVVRSSVLKMMSSTFAFAFGLPMKSFETRNEALSYLRASRSKD